MFTTGLNLAISFGAMVGGWAIGRANGGTRRVYRCATCESFLEATAAVCPVCGGTVARDIKHRRDRLDAEAARARAVAEVQPGGG